MKERIGRISVSILASLIFVAIVLLFRPTWTPKIASDNAISELKAININGTKLEVMIRGKDKSNPVIIFVHGGPSCSEIPYVRKYQDLLENDFTIVHYDQRGSGKSYHFFEDYSKLSAQTHVDDLLKLTDYVAKQFDQEKVILIGHSYGTYIGMQAAAQAPEKFTAYIGLGQVADQSASELESLNFCMAEAQNAGNTSDVAYLQSLTEAVKNQGKFVPRSYVRKYGGAARLIDDNADATWGLFFSTEYNWFDAIRYKKGLVDNQGVLTKELIDHSLTKSITDLDLPFYFVLGKYDGMTSTAVAKKYFDTINTSYTKAFNLYENSAHYPQFEEKERFYHWMHSTFKQSPH